MKIRINKFLAHSGVCSRRQADFLISQNKIKINNKIAIIGDSVDTSVDEVFYNNQKIQINENMIYYAVHKPVNYTSTTYDKYAQKNVIDLVPKKPRVFPVGRLDKNSEGLIILTNDGDLTNILTHPKYNHEKEYLVKCKIQKFNQSISVETLKQKLKKLTDGVNFEEGVAKIDRINLINFNFKKNEITLNIVMHQGLKRQIRRMCEKINFEVVLLKRVRVEKLKLGNLKSGDYKIINKDDII